MADIAFERLAAPVVTSNTDATSYVTNSGTPVSGALYYVVVGALRAAGQTATPTLSGTNGWSGTWTQRGTVIANAQISCTVFSSAAVSAVAGTLTADFGVETQDACIISVVRIRNANAAPVQSKTGTTVAGTTISVTLDSPLTDVWNAVFFAVVNDATTGTMTQAYNDVLFYTVGLQVAATDGVRVNVLGATGETTTVAPTGFTSSDIAGVLLEIDHDGSDVTAGGVIGRGLNRAAAY